MSDQDLSGSLGETVRQALSKSTPLAIVGGGTKAFYGRESQGQPLAVAGHCGIIKYEPTELVITARAGTRLSDLEAALAEGGQMLGFEPPHFGAQATLGGAVASGLSGPRRPYAGAARDLVLGVKLLTGRGEILRFGGEVMKNVAGFDVSRLQAGSLGCLGVILEVSLKVQPRPPRELTLTRPCAMTAAIEAMNRWAGLPYPFSALAYDGERLYVRLSGAASGVQAAARQIGGEEPAEAGTFWTSLREHTHPFFTSAGDAPLWRLSVPPATPPLDLPGRWFLEWGGAQRWLLGTAEAEAVRRRAAAVGGHATLFRGGDRRGAVFQPLDPVLLRLHRALKHSFDPQGIFNPGRMYPEF